VSWHQRSSSLHQVHPAVDVERGAGNEAVEFAGEKDYGTCDIFYCAGAAKRDASAASLLVCAVREMPTRGSTLATLVHVVLVPEAEFYSQIAGCPTDPVRALREGRSHRHRPLPGWPVGHALQGRSHVDQTDEAHT